MNATFDALIKAGGDLENAALNMTVATPREMTRRAEQVEVAVKAWREAAMAASRSLADQT
jgi:hypothetical protein